MRTTTIRFLLAASFAALGAFSCGGDDGDDGGLSCESYCATIMANCSGDNAQYGSVTQCEESCAAFTEGTADEMSGNTLGCRTYHAGAADSTGMPDLHCPHAGPAGAGVCGGTCESFCTIALDSCAETFENMQDCMTQCAGFPAEPTYNATITTGDSFACRMYHLTVASDMPEPHCAHIVEASATCGGAALQ